MSLSSRQTTTAATTGPDFREKILDIGKPTRFEHGIHVEYNRENGKYMVRIALALYPVTDSSLFIFRAYQTCGSLIYQVMISSIRII
jgi:hypothetical protein